MLEHIVASGREIEFDVGMAMPPGGGSSWFHSSDSYQLLGDDGLVWASLDVPLSRERLTVAMPYAGSQWDYFHVLSVSTSDGRVLVTAHHPLMEQPRETVWAADTAPAALVPHRELRRRGKFEGHLPDAPLLATLTAEPGTITLCDARAAPRLQLLRGARSAWPTIGAGTTAVSFHLEGPVRVVATSLP